MNVCLLGVSFDTSNNGVKALSASLIGLIMRALPDARIFLLTQSRYNTPLEMDIDGKKVMVERVNLRYSPNSDPWEHVSMILITAILWRFIPLGFLRNAITKRNRWIRSLLNADRVGDIFGGDSFSDIYGVRLLCMNLIERLIVILSGKKIDFLPQTFGPFTSRYSRSMAHFFLSRARTICSRDIESIQIVNSILYKVNFKVEFCPDVAFTLESKIPSPKEVLPLEYELKREGLFGLNISGLMYSKAEAFSTLNYRELAQNLTKHILNSTDAHILLIPHTFGMDDPADPRQDLFACREVYDATIFDFPGRLHLINYPYDQHEIKGIIGMCSFFAGSRMHACIAALSQEIPAAGIAYSKKFAGVFSSVGVRDLVIDARTGTIQKVIEDVIVMYQRREEFAARLSREIPIARKKIESTFKSIFS